jgi:hypothetical protein
MHGTGVFEQMLHATSPRGGHDAIRGEKRARKEEGKEAAPLARATRAVMEQTYSPSKGVEKMRICGGSNTTLARHDVSGTSLLARLTGFSTVP